MKSSMRTMGEASLQGLFLLCLLALFAFARGGTARICCCLGGACAATRLDSIERKRGHEHGLHECTSLLRLGARGLRCETAETTFGSADLEGAELLHALDLGDLVQLGETNVDLVLQGLGSGTLAIAPTFAAVLICGQVQRNLVARLYEEWQRRWG